MQTDLIACSRPVCASAWNGITGVDLPDEGRGRGDFTYGNLRCIAAEDAQTFTQAKLPQVNDVVTLNADRGLYEQSELEEEVDQFSPPRLDLSKSECKPVWHEPAAGGDLRPGDKLRILGYRTFIGHWTPAGSKRQFPQQLLFALVMPTE